MHLRQQRIAFLSPSNYNCLSPTNYKRHKKAKKKALWTMAYPNNGTKGWGAAVLSSLAGASSPWHSLGYLPRLRAGRRRLPPAPGRAPGRRSRLRSRSGAAPRAKRWGPGGTGGVTVTLLGCVPSRQGPCRRSRARDSPALRHRLSCANLRPPA